MNMNKQKTIATSDAPAAIGPYSQAVSAGGFVFVSGQLPIDPATGAFEGDDVASQTERSLKSVRAILAAAGLGMSDIVKTTVYLKDIDDFSAMNEVYAKYFDKDCPARAAIAVAGIPKNALVEIEAVAYDGR